MTNLFKKEKTVDFFRTLIEIPNPSGYTSDEYCYERR
ncbi:Uncharacterised protein [Sporosarcina pasteurii]|uniref:Uncharacterized protein n=1 Tax=Sporosarcina pasteurii TaxID=1474 RepID=A0A380BEI3_SPOPA|nr:Uncharacterised protein [Sporosarcina pasteurii]